MIEDIEYNGKCYFLDNKNEKYISKLIMDKEIGISLEIVGLSNFDNRNIDIINFRDFDNIEFTLFKCHCSHGLHSKISHWDIVYAIQGHCFETTDNLRFTSVSASFNNLNEWVGVTGFENSNNGIENNTVISYKTPNPINFKIDDKVDGSFIFRSTRPVSPKFQATVKEEVILRIETNSKKAPVQDLLDNVARLEDEIPLLEILEYIIKFNNFLTLGMYQATVPLRIELESRKQLRDVGPKVLQGRFFLYYLMSNEYSNRRLYRQLYSFKSISNSFELIVSNWFSKYINLEPVLNILLESFYFNSQFNENNFLNMAQAVETFHRRMRKSDKNSYQHNINVSMTKKLLPEYLYGYFEEKLKYNETSLHNRLTDLCNEFKPDLIIKLIDDKEKFIQQIKDNRNYYTHYDPRYEKKKKVLKGAELLFLTEKLKVLLVCCILKEIGFSDKDINSNLNNIQYNYHHLFKINNGA